MCGVRRPSQGPLPPPVSAPRNPARGLDTHVCRHDGGSHNQGPTATAMHGQAASGGGVEAASQPPPPLDAHGALSRQTSQTFAADHLPAAGGAGEEHQGRGGLGAALAAAAWGRAGHGGWMWSFSLCVRGRDGVGGWVTGWRVVKHVLIGTRKRAGRRGGTRSKKASQRNRTEHRDAADTLGWTADWAKGDRRSANLTGGSLGQG